MGYFSIHNHTEYSNLRLLDSINKVEDLIDYAFELGLSGVCITDHETLSGHIKAIQHYNKRCSENEKWKDLKLGLGNEIYLCRNDLSAETYEKGEKFPHFILVAKDKEGHHQLRQLSSKAWSQSFNMFLTRVPTHYKDIEEIVKANPGHLIASSACAGSILNILRKENKEKEAIEIIKWCKDIFKDDYYLELQPALYQEQIDYNLWLLKVAKELDVKCIITTDSHYLKKEDREIHTAFLNSKEGDRETAEFYLYTYMMSQEEIENNMKDYIDVETIKEILENTNEVKDKIESYDLAKPQIVPHLIDDRKEIKWEEWLKWVRIQPKYEYLNKYLTSPNEDDRFFLAIALHRLNELDLSKEERAEYLDRLEGEATELWLVSEIIKQPLSAYLLTVRTIVKTIWDETNSLVGISRGSAGALLFGYLIGMIDMNPMTCGLFLDYRRFVHREKPELSDVDLDTEGCRRNFIINKLNEIMERQGGRSLNVATFGTLSARSSILTAARGLGIDNDIAQYLASLVGQERGFSYSLSDCIYGNEEKERKPVKEMIDEMNKYPNLLETCLKIEGLVCQTGIHASGICLYDGDVNDYCCSMKAPNGLDITQWDLHMSEYAGSLKFDLLSVEALDKIHVCMNLLEKDGLIENKGSLRKTYLEYLHPTKLDYDNKKMWDLLAANKIIDAFQMDTAVAKQSAKAIHPSNVPELAAVNSLMRLMPDKGQATPVEEYVEYKLHPEKLKEEIFALDGDSKQKEILYSFLETYNGVPSSQESVMYLSMIPELTNFSFGEANKLRKLISKKQMDKIMEFRETFFEKGRDNNVSDDLLSFMWDKQIHRQLGYSFSDIHTIAYSLIALQEMNLNVKYHPIYWATACLIINSGAADEDNGGNTNYGKLASAIGRIQTEGYIVDLPFINEANFAFTPDIKNNRIIYGFKGISEIGDDFIKTIIDNRPYKSINDFIEKCNPQKKQMINLIKAGVFDEFDNRKKIMKEYLYSIYPQKARISLQNMNSLIDYNLIPKDLISYVYLYNFNKYLKQLQVPEGFRLDKRAMEFIIKNFPDIDITSGYLNDKEWKKLYDKGMESFKTWMKENEEELKSKIQEKEIETIWEQYCPGNNSTWEMDTLGFYHSGHELSNINIETHSINNLLDGNYKNSVDIAGTVLGKEAYKHMVTLLTPDGVISLKFSKESFARYNRVISEVIDGTKKTLEKSWFVKGTLLLVNGYKSGETFRVRNLSRIIEVMDDGNIKTTRYRYGEG